MLIKNGETIFQPITGTEEKIKNHSCTPGNFYIAADTGKMFLDTDKKTRIAVGGSGTSLYYADTEALKLADESTGDYYYVIALDGLDDQSANPMVDDLILNTDGAFYRITRIDGDNLYCNRLAVSGSGGDDGDDSGSGKAMTIKGYALETVNLVNGQSATSKFKATSAIDSNGEALDDELTANWSISVTSTGVVYDSGTFKVASGEDKEFEFGSRLRESTGSTLSIYVTGVNSGKSKTITWDVTTVELLLYESEKFNNLSVFSSSFTMYCNVSGNIEKILEWSIDDEVVGEQTLAKGIIGEQKFTVSGLDHGYHTVSINLYQSIDGEKGMSVEAPLSFEIAVDAGEDTPIVWLGDYSKEYYNYDAIKIPYKVYDPKNEEVTVNFVKGITNLGTRTESSSATSFSYWQITDATVDIMNTYFIQAIQNILDSAGNIIETKTISREISFSVAQDPTRDLSLVSQETLMLNFDAAGRSNNETETSRASWSYTNTLDASNPITYKAKFINFNWYNNGWTLDENNDTCLRISNGASFSIPIGNMVLNNSIQTAQQSRTFEFQFKVRNVQDYNNLIKEYTRYSGDTEYWDAFVKQMNDENGYDNYDNYLKYLSTQPDAKFTYDDISANFSGITRLVASKTPFCSYYDANGRGLCLGSQDGFFSSASNTLNVKYVEDQMINLSIVFSYTDKRIYIYLQGVLTAVCKYTDASTLVIASDAIVFNSEYCDVDLYKFRIYNNALSIRDILINYAVDHTSVIDYDHTTKLITYNRNTNEYQLDYSLVRDWNRGDDEDGDDVNRNDYLMPYVIWDTGSASTKLPYSKADKKLVGMSFVNTPLDYAYKTGTLDDLAEQMTDEQKAAAVDEGLTNVQYYYKHHCPSFVSREKQVSLAVQGTSSEFYPRRNYKAKTKGTDENGDDCIYMYMNRGPFKELYNSGSAEDLEKCHLDFFYYNNYSVGTTKFTCKIDFMESSGTYNMGLANLVNSTYTKHPLDDYGAAGAITELGYELCYDAEADTNNMTYYVDAKGKTKAKFTDEAPYEPGKYYIPSYKAYTFSNTKELRTNVQGFPVMAFWKYGDSDSSYQFLGRYNLLTDKGSDETYGFKPDKKISQPFGNTKKGIQQTIRKIAECWEYSDNARGYCSFRDPSSRHKLNFDKYTYSIENKEVPNGYKLVSNDTFQENITYYSYNTEEGSYTKVTLDATSYEPNVYYTEDYKTEATVVKNRDLNAKKSCPFVADSFEYRYNTNADFLDYIYDPVTNADVYEDLLEDYAATDLADIDFRSEEMLSMYQNWEKACQWVWSTCVDNVPTEAALAAGTATARKIMTYEKAEGTFDASTTYYDENEDLVTDPQEVMFNAGLYYIGTPTTVTFKDGKSYAYETKEYRLAKFTNELSEHFDLEYLLVYFIMTEVLLAYDSRGKNCMMASWGPKTEGGEYIWYPIFYDMDTQLGINNTGIPSFEYSENATMDGTFSTSDSVLWNNLYTCFFDQIKGKYKELRHQITSATNTRYNGMGALQTVDHIEKWYLADPDETGEIEMRGARPLCMFNMDEQFKYISICNPKIQYQNRQGTMTTDSDGAFFYALQGNRSLSRQQFLARRLNFVDSWLSEGNYSRSEGTNIRGRIGANKPSVFSDKWINQANSDAGSEFEVSPYYVTDEKGNTVLDEKGYPKKTNYLDADFFVELTPYQKSWVTLGNDNESYASKEYEDKAVRYELPASNIEGIKNSPNLTESLIYIYGADTIADIGDVSTLYWTEFRAERSPHLQKLLLGNDHPDFYNYSAFSPVFDAGKESDYGKPLLKEVNLTGLTKLSATDFDFSTSEKLQIFKAIRSNVTSVKFADGVALHTLYLPNTITSLSLTEAKNLTTILTDLNQTAFDTSTYTDPDKNEYYSTYYPATNTWVAKQGLYIEGLTNLKESEITSTTSCALSEIKLAGDAFGYDSYNLLHKLYKVYKDGAGDGAAELKISMTDVDWSPYKKLDADAVYDSSNAYYTDDYHYGFKDYTYTSAAQWELDLTNGEVYQYDANEFEKYGNTITDIQMLLDFIERVQFKNTTSTGASTPVITGSIYVNNTTPIDENLIRNTLLTDSNFPASKLDIHFKKVIKGYSARFLQVETDGTYTVIGTQVLPSTSSTTAHFANPYTIYSASRDNYDFHGWSTVNNDTGIIEESAWDLSDNTSLTSGQYDYTFYAIFTRHRFAMNFMVGTQEKGFVKACEHEGTLYGDFIEVPNVIPAIDESDLDLEMKYQFLGWTQEPKNVIAASAAKAKTVNVSKIQATSDMTFYAVFTQQSVYAEALSSDYYTIIETKYYRDVDTQYPNFNNGLTGAYLQLNSGANLNGKVTLPTTTEDGRAIIGVQGFSNQSGITHIFWKGDPHLLTIVGSCFSYCTNLQYFQYPKTLRIIGNQAFSYCAKLELPDFSLGSLNSGTYSGLTNLLEIGQSAYAGLSVKSDVSVLFIPGSVKRLMSFAFGNVDQSYSSRSVINLLQFGTETSPTYITATGSSYLQNYAIQMTYEGDDMCTIANVRVYYDPSNKTDLTASTAAGKIFYTGQFETISAGGTT